MRRHFLFGGVNFFAFRIEGAQTVSSSRSASRICFFPDVETDESIRWARRSRSAASIKRLSERPYVAAVQRFADRLLQLAFTPFVAFRPGIDDQPAAEGSLRSLVADDEMIAAQDQQRLVQA